MFDAEPPPSPSLESRVRVCCKFDDESYYNIACRYFDVAIQVHSIVETQKGHIILRGWRGGKFGPQNRKNQREFGMFRVRKEIFKRYIVAPEPRIGKAIEQFGKECLMEIDIYDEHKDSLEGIKSGDYVALQNVHAACQKQIYSLILHGGPQSKTYQRGISKIPPDFDDVKFQELREKVEKALEEVTDYHGYKEFDREESPFKMGKKEMEEAKKVVYGPCRDIGIPGLISVDRFLKTSKTTTYHFLTHAHSDHTKGLDKKWKRKVYCSPATAKILYLIMGYKTPEDVPEGIITPLRMNVPHEFDGFKVTLIDANHCPGAVMLIFAGEKIQNATGGPILCTGDFRADQKFLNSYRMRFLENQNFSKIYLDNTYLSTEISFPSRDESLELIKKALDQNTDKNIIIPMNRLGREDLLEKINLHLHEPVFVNKEKLEVAQTLNFFFEIGRERDDRRVEVRKRNDKKKSAPALPENTIILDITMLFHMTENPNEQRENVIQIPYSDHSSRQEILAFLKRLNFQKIHPTSKKYNEYEMKMMMAAGKARPIPIEDFGSKIDEILQKALKNYESTSSGIQNPSENQNPAEILNSDDDDEEPGSSRDITILTNSDVTVIQNLDVTSSEDPEAQMLNSDVAEKPSESTEAPESLAATMPMDTQILASPNPNPEVTSSSAKPTSSEVPEAQIQNVDVKSSKPSEAQIQNPDAVENPESRPSTQYLTSSESSGAPESQSLDTTQPLESQKSTSSESPESQNPDVTSSGNVPILTSSESRFQNFDVVEDPESISSTTQNLTSSESSKSQNVDVTSSENAPIPTSFEAPKSTQNIDFPSAKSPNPTSPEAQNPDVTSSEAQIPKSPTSSENMEVDYSDAPDLSSNIQNFTSSQTSEATNLDVAFAESPESPEAQNRDVASPESPESLKFDVRSPEYPEAENFDVRSPEYPEAENFDVRSPEFPKAQKLDVTSPESPESPKSPEAQNFDVTSPESPKSPEAQNFDVTSPESPKSPEAQNFDVTSPESPESPKAQNFDVASPESQKSPEAQNLDVTSPESPESPEAQNLDVTSSSSSNSTSSERPESSNFDVVIEATKRINDRDNDSDYEPPKKRRKFE